MNNKQDRDEQIAQALYQASASLEAKEDLYYRIQNNINQQQKRERFMMKRSVKYGMVCALLLMTTTAVYAMGNITNWVSHSSSEDSFKGFPSVTEVAEKVGFSPKYVKQFANDFNYMKASVGESAGNDADGNTVVNFKEVTFFYSKDGASLRDKYLALSTAPVVAEAVDTNAEAMVATYNGIELRYDTQTYKFVPVDYTLTAEDQAQMDAGTLEVSYGTDKVEMSQMQYISWIENDISYQLLNSDYTELSQEDMVAMAQEIIDAK